MNVTEGRVWSRRSHPETLHTRHLSAPRWAVAACAAALLPLSVTAAPAVAKGPSPSTITTDAVNAYVYGYPLVLMQATEQLSTNVVKPNSTTIQAPVNQLARAANVPGPQTRTVVSPNLDTLYTPAWLDLRAEPMVLHVPNTHGRYYLMPTLSAWTTSSPPRANGPPAPAQATSPSRVPPGTAGCPPGSPRSSLPRTPRGS